MSLFNAREWWSVKNGSQEEFDYGCLCTGNIDNDPQGKEKIITGSFSGILRVYYPRQKDFRIEDLLAEEQLEFPILQIEIGKFVANTQNNCIAVLHPRVLVMYTLDPVGDYGADASYFKLSKQFERQLGVDGEHFTAHSMVVGPFGGSRDRDNICVQSLDGRLQVFEQDSYAFMQQFNGCLVPGPLCYVRQLDSILTASTDSHVECYNYRVLATASCAKKGSGGGEEKHSDSGINKQKKLHSEWRTNVGEHVLQIGVGRLSSSITGSQFDIVVLCEHTLFCLKSNGTIRLQKRLGYFPSTFCLYPRCETGDEVSDNIIIGTHSKQWMIYQDTQLIWSTTAQTVPVQLSCKEFGNTRGLIVSLDQEGVLSINYLGTDPLSAAVGATEGKELNYEELDEEHRQLLNTIRQSQTEQRVEPRERVLLRVQVPEILDAVGENPEAYHPGGNYAKSDQGGVMQLTVRIFVSYTGKGVIRNVTLSIVTPDSITASESSVLLPMVDGSSSTPLIVPVTLFPGTELTPTSLELTVSAAYTLETGQPRTTLFQAKLPMTLAARVVPPIKASTFKFTLVTNLDSPQLTDLFSDMLSQPGRSAEWTKQIVNSAANVLSCQYYNGVDATIVVSKNAGRYRIQSSELEALWLISSELVDRLKAYYAQHQGIDKLEFSYEEKLPLGDFYAAIDAHFNIRKRIHELATALNDRAHQFRIIQKRLLVRFKDRNPSPLQQVDLLMHGTYEEILRLAEETQSCQKQLVIAANRLSCTTHLTLLLIRFRFNLSDAGFDVLRSHLIPQVNDNAEQGWEELVDAGMTNLLRTVLSKSSKSAVDAVVGPGTLAIAEDTKKLQKHITIVCDRLAKGSQLVPGENPRSFAKGSESEGKEREAKERGAKD